MPAPRYSLLIGLVLAAASTRLVPHWFNFTPIGAIALFSGAHIADKRLAFAVPFLALLLSDLLLGFYAGIGAVYLSFALIVCVGFWLRSRCRPVPILGAALASSVLFFVTTNFALWAAGALYPRTWDGLVTCFAAAIPFFRGTVAGDLFYAAALFGAFAWAERTFVVFRGRAAVAG